MDVRKEPLRTWMAADGKGKSMTRTKTTEEFDTKRLVETLTTGVLIVDAQATILWCNESAETLMGCSKRSLLGSNAGLFVVTLPDWIERLQEATDQGAPVSSFVPLQRGPSFKDVQVLAVLSSMGEDRYLLELSESEQSVALQKAEQSAGRSDATRALLRNLAHEIKNPLGGIRGAAQLLESELPTKNLSEYTEVIIGETDRLQALVDRFLSPYRNGRQCATINLHEVLEHVQQLVISEFPKGLTIERDYDVSVPDFEGNREELVQVFLNLMRNAAQALTEHAVSDARITLRTRVARDVLIGMKRIRTALCAEVIDNGFGIAPSVRDKLFYPLVTTRPKGTGLGLSLVQTYVERHAGAIEVESESGKTVFRILFRLGRQTR